MGESQRSSEHPKGSKFPPKRRIETQIHRRKKAKAVPPLEAEWDMASGTPPTGLRTPPEKMQRNP